jgi:hypothetical protein
MSEASVSPELGESQLRGVPDGSLFGSQCTLTQFFIEEGGFPIKIALFPKSKKAIEESNYCLILNKIVESRLLKTKIHNNKFFEEIYLETLSKQ